MSNTLYHLYQKKTLALIKSLIIKSNFTADAMNIAVSENGYSVTNNKSTWRYYLHLAGMSHAADSPIYITSHDTLEEIAYTTANFQIHRGTYLNYLIDPQYVNKLYIKYPEQTNYICGVLNPIDINKAISATEGTILYYDQTLVEDNETSLISDLQETIYRIVKRWNVTDYRIIDDLYPSAFYAILFATLPSILLNLRLARCKTPEAHDFHIREYLSAHGGLDRYIDVLTTEQVLWLYRNIKSILTNAGKQETLDLLVDNILTKLKIPLSHYVAEHNVGDMPDGLSPIADFIQVPVNYKRIQDSDIGLSVYEMLVKEREVAIYNEETEMEYLPLINEAIETSPTNLLPTKILESSMLDYGEYSPFTITSTLLNHWGYLASKGRYSAIISFNIGIDTLLLNANDAYIFFLYALHKSLGITLNKVPRTLGMNLRNINTPTFAQLRRLASRQHIDDGFINQALTDLPVIGNYISTISFREGITAIHRRLQKHRLDYTTLPNYLSRGMGKGIIMHIYPALEYSNTSTEISYADWFRSKSIIFDESNLNATDWTAIYSDIATKALGEVKGKKSLKEIQSSAIALMKQLTSYSVQWIATINDSLLLLMENPAIKLGDGDLSLSSYSKIKLKHDIVSLDSHVKTDVSVSVKHLMSARPESLQMSARINYSSVLNHKASASGANFLRQGALSFYLGAGVVEEEEEIIDVVENMKVIAGEPYRSVDDTVDLIHMFSFRIDEITPVVADISDSLNTSGVVATTSEITRSVAGVNTTPIDTLGITPAIEIDIVVYNVIDIPYTPPSANADTVGISMGLGTFNNIVTPVNASGNSIEILYPENKAIALTFSIGSNNKLVP